MLLLELFNRSKKTPKLTPDERAELEQQRRGELRQTAKPNEKVSQEAKGSNPESYDKEVYGDWHKTQLKTQGKTSSEGPRKGDVIMTSQGSVVVDDPNGSGAMIAHATTSSGKTIKVSWGKLSRPVAKNNKQYYTLD